MPNLDDVPQWLMEEVFGGMSERWLNEQTVSLPTFLEKYNLHDSTWYGIWLKLGFHALVILRWDTFHPKTLYPNLFHQDIWYGEPILMFRLNILPYQIMTFTTENEISFRPIISRASSKVITSEEQAKMLDIATTDELLKDKLKDFVLEAELHHTTFEGLFGDEVHLIHRPDVKMLCVDFSGNILKVPL